MVKESIDPSACERHTVHLGWHSHLLLTHRPCPEHTLLKFCTARRCGPDRCAGRFVASNRVGHPHNEPLHPGRQMHTPLLQRPWFEQLRGQRLERVAVSTLAGNWSCTDATARSPGNTARSPSATACFCTLVTLSSVCFSQNFPSKPSRHSHLYATHVPRPLQPLHFSCISCLGNHARCRMPLRTSLPCGTWVDSSKSTRTTSRDVAITPVYTRPLMGTSMVSPTNMPIVWLFGAGGGGLWRSELFRTICWAGETRVQTGI